MHILAPSSERRLARPYRRQRLARAVSENAGHDARIYPRALGGGEAKLFRLISDYIVGR